MPKPIRVIKQTLELFGPERRWRWLVLVLLAIFVAALEALGALMIIVLMGLVSSPSGEISLPLIGDLQRLFPGAGRDGLLIGVALAIGSFFAFRGLAMFGQAYIRARLVHNASASLASHLVRGYLAMPYIDHTQINSAELVRNSTEAVREFTGRVVTPLAKVIAEFVVVAGLLCVLLWASPVATAIAVASFLPLTWLLLRVIQPRLKKLGREAQDLRATCLKAVQQALGGVRDIKLLGREDYFAQIFKSERKSLARTAYLRESIAELPRSLIETTLVLIVVAMFSIAILAGDSVEGLLATLGVFAYAGIRLQPSLRQIVQGMNDIKFGAAVIDDLLVDRRRADKAISTRAAQAFEDSELHLLRDELRLDDVGFNYPNSRQPALSQIDLVIKRGQFIGVCGPTGGGKSTLVDLIAGLLQPTSGVIRLDGQDLRDLEYQWWQQLGVVSQNVFLIDDTVRNNIVLGRSRDELEEDKLELAIQRAQLLDVVTSLPDGLDTMVGERGIRLSGGQRQRVAIARAFYREPSVLIFDEGTSALDTATESALVEAIDSLKHDRTLIAVAHRIATIQNADSIIVIKDGRISGNDSYSRLLQNNPLFQSLAQARYSQPQSTR